MAQLTPAFFKTILRIEGGYQNNPSDNGNYACGQLVGTKYGVSAVAYNTWTGHCPTQAEMQGITQDTAYNFYAWYFDRYNLYQVESQQLFELLANNTMGSPANAAKVEQRVLNALGYPVDVDGQRGPQTLAALNDAWRKNPAALYNGVRSAWITYLSNLGKPQFLPGWLKRMESFPPLQAAAVGGGALVVLAIIVYALTQSK
jgi:lysozyme family protein